MTRGASLFAALCAATVIASGGVRACRLLECVAARRRLAAEPPVAHRERRSAWSPIPRQSARLATETIAELLDGIAADVRSGSTLGAAITAAQRRDGGDILLGSALRQWRAGTTLAASLAVQRPATSVERPDHVRLALTTLSACATIGGPVADTIDRSAATLREHAAIEAERRAHTSQARASMWVLTCVPVGFALWSTTTDPAVRAFLLSSPVGWLCASSGTALAATGWWWMRAIVDGDAR